MADAASGNQTINLGFAQRSETWLSVSFLSTLAVLILPLPTFLLDMFITVNLAAAILLLLITLNAKRPLDVSVFPSLLLLLTLFRLALNVATTRLILLYSDAGKIVDTFGELVVGGDLIVGCVIFLILVTIQFIVITKGATRISEVNARFTLDALPGKQMAIDAELNVGAINEQQAKERRKELAAEAEFYGAMDGASKYVRGDAIAGLVIMAVNIIGGVLISISTGNTVVDAFKTYSILTVGDGLISQIPALIIATSAGVLVTKSSSENNLAVEISGQMIRSYRAIFTGAIILVCLAFVPGLPKFPFFALALAIFWFARRAKSIEEDQSEPQEESQTEEEPSPIERGLEQFLIHDRIIVEIGVGLIKLVEPPKGRGLADRIATLREDIASQYGFWVPHVRLRDQMQMGTNDYQITICGRVVGKGQLMADRLLAINSGNSKPAVDGIDVVDPAFGLPATWISPSDRRRAEINGFTVVDASTVLVTHLGEQLKKHAHEILSREDLQKMLNRLKEHSPTVVSEIKPDTLRPGTLHQLLVNLLKESVPINSLETILESAINHAVAIKDVDQLTEKVRADIAPVIVDRFLDDQQKIRVILLEPKLEHYLRENVQGNMIALQPHQLENLVDRYRQLGDVNSLNEKPVAALIDSTIRRELRQTLFRSLPEVSFIAYTEIPGDMLIEPVAMIRYEEVFALTDSGEASEAMATTANERTQR